MTEGAAAARALLAAERYAVLSTHGVRHAGWPFASLAPYALTPTGEPLLLLSDLAEHTRNLVADPRACLFVQDSAGQADPQAGARLSLLGRVETVSVADAPEARTRYLIRHPQAQDYFVLDFRLYVLHVEHARYIAGFADMGWLAGTALQTI